MKTQEPVTEFDLRKDEFKDHSLKLNELEFDKDGNVVRKDRFETGMRQMHGILIESGVMSSREPWTVDDVVQRMRALIESLKINGSQLKCEQFDELKQDQNR